MSARYSHFLLLLSLFPRFSLLLRFSETTAEWEVYLRSHCVQFTTQIVEKIRHLSEWKPTGGKEQEVKSIIDKVVECGGKFSTRNNKLYFTEQAGGKELEVLAWDNKQEEGKKQIEEHPKAYNLLKQMWYNPQQAGSFMARDKFYCAVKEKYLNISKRSVERFLQFQGAYQRTRPILKHSVIKPIIVDGPGCWYQIDMADLGSDKRKSILIYLRGDMSAYTW